MRGTPVRNLSTRFGQHRGLEVCSPQIGSVGWGDRFHKVDLRAGMISFPSLWVLLLEVSYHLRIQRGVTLRVGLSAKRKP